MEEEIVRNKPRVQFARKVARDLLANVGIKSAPVLLGPIFDFLRRDSQITLQAWDFPEEVDGVHFLDKGNVVIGYNENSAYCRKRFTIAHEMGHFLLKHLDRTPDVDFYTKNPVEVEANQFAAELLMPLSFIKEDFKNNQNIKKIAQKYRVSEEALGWKLYDQKII